jgi:hypothetical protein
VNQYGDPGFCSFAIDHSSSYWWAVFSTGSLGGGIGNHCSEYDKFVLRSKTPFLRLAYVLALQYRGSVEKTWVQCCDDAASMLNSLGFICSAFSSQHSYSTFEWVSDDGQRALHPKSASYKSRSGGARFACMSV